MSLYPVPLNPPARGVHPSFCLYIFAYPGRFIKVESSNMWSFATGFYHKACIRAPFFFTAK